jgi:plastocyanin domain-containing protein/YHS domain-containing protein
MSLDLLFVNLAGVLAVAWIVWFFFLSRREEERVTTSVGRVQEVEVTVKGGYIPDVVKARPGVPLRIRFRREETSTCSEEVVFPDFGIRRHLPAFETTTIELPAAPSGSYGFACGMDMMHGRVVVDEATAPRPPTKSARKPLALATVVVSEIDPICGMSVDPTTAKWRSERDGKDVYFCAEGCKRRFDTA